MSVARRLFAAALAIGLLPALGGPAAAARTLVADLSSREIAITTGFTGTRLLLFGAKDPGGDVVVVIRGPARDHTVRRRVRIAGMWVNGDSMVFRGPPVFYHVAATRPLETMASPAALADRRIGFDRLALAAPEDAGDTATSPARSSTTARASLAAPEDAGDTATAYRKALIRNKIRQRLYGYDPAGVQVISGRLFRAAVVFPANVPTGPYRVEVFLFDQGREIVRRESTLVVRKVGIEAGLFNLAHRNSALYGAAAVLIALGFGWLAGAIFRT